MNQLFFRRRGRSRRWRSRSRVSGSSRSSRSTRTRGNRRGRRQDRISLEGSENSRLRCNRRVGNWRVGWRCRIDRKSGEKWSPLRMCRRRGGCGNRRCRWKCRIERKGGEK